MSKPLARAMAGLKPYEQPFTGLHNAPYQLPPYEQPGAFSNQMMPMEGYMRPPQAPPPQVPQQPAMPPMPPPQQVGAPAPMEMAPGSMPPVTMGQQAPQLGRNELERDYLRQLAENPNGFNSGWLGRLFG